MFQIVVWGLLDCPDLKQNIHERFQDSVSSFVSLTANQKIITHKKYRTTNENTESFYSKCKTLSIYTYSVISPQKPSQ